MQKVQLFDTTLRDGEQSPGVNLNVYEKLQIANQLERLGIDIIEAGFAAASPGDFDSIRQIANMCKQTSVTSLARAKESDILTAWEALKDGAHPRLHVFLATSDIHMKYKLKMSREEVIDTIVSSVRFAKKYFPIIQVSAEDACRTDRAFLSRFVEESIRAGASVINIPDTVGYTNPAEYIDLFQYLQQHVPSFDKAIFSCHCHDDLGMATANSLAAISAGVRQVEGTINGIGERAGNAALEEIAVALHIRNDLYNVKTNMNLKEIKKTSSLVSRLTGMAIQKNKAIVGANAFAHESGIHQDGVLKEVTTYEIISPDLVGVETNNLVLGKHSGRHAFTEHLERLGYSLSNQERDRAFAAFKKLADSKKEVTDDDLHVLVLGEKVSLTQKYEVSQLHVTFHSNGLQTAMVELTGADGKCYQDAAAGKGSIESIYNAIERILGLSCRLEDYRIQSITQGEDALAQVHVVLDKDGKKVTGYGVAFDVLEASAKAYVNAACKFSIEIPIQS
ncbi:MAG: 2-isopropylmalate synthase [Bacillaceae bacterium]